MKFYLSLLLEMKKQCMSIDNHEENTGDINYNRIVDELVDVVSTKEQDIAVSEAKPTKDIKI